MSILLREYCNYQPLQGNQKKDSLVFKESENNFCAPNPDTLMVEIEGIHSYPFHTRNCTRYMPQCLKESEPKWTHPYLKPLIKHHNDQNGEIIGRIYNATYVNETSIKGVGGLNFTVAVPDEKAAKDVENRILETVSIGVDAEDVRCSICGSHITNAAEGCPEGHIRGAEYEGDTCYWDVYKMTPKELSYVIVPSDIYAKNLKKYRAKEVNKDRMAQFQEAYKLNNINLKENNSNKTTEPDGGKKPHMDFEKELESAKATIEELNKELSEAKESAAQEISELKEKNAELEKVIGEVREALASKEKEVTEVSEKLKVSEEDKEVAYQEKEAAEASGLEAQESYRSVMEELYKLYRDLTNKPTLEESVIEERPLDHIKYGIQDMKEEYSATKTKTEILDMKEQKQVPNPVAPSNEVPPKTNPKKEEKTLDLSEQVSKLFVKLC